VTKNGRYDEIDVLVKQRIGSISQGYILGGLSTLDQAMEDYLNAL